MDGQSWFKTDKQSLPSLLINAGFDVYLGNDRGTRNSMRHEKLDPISDAEKFFNYSYAELGLYDAEANLYYVRE